MQTTITRRTALAASVTLPLLPVAAYATTADPAVEAYREWRAAYDVRAASLEADVEDNTPEGQVFSDREWAARLALSNARATTPAGLTCRVMFALGVFGDLTMGGSINNADDFEFHGWIDDHEGRLLRSILAGAENMEEVS